MKPGNVLMIQGCTSDAGKTTLVAGLCRVFSQHGYQIAPFKPQNMALNSAVTEEGGEIGRGQALQAEAAGVPLSVHMNPVLLKPNSDTGAQVILQGQSIGNLEALDYHQYKPKAAQAVFDSFNQLGQRYPFILVEGAGSPAEVNLREGDIANMGFAEAVDCPVILIADIDKGGVFAHFIGTLACLSQSEQDRVKGFVINRFRGDIALLQDGLDWLEQKTGKPVLGVLPYLHGLHLDAEDAIAAESASKSDVCTANPSLLKVICPLLPHLSNHTDLDPLIHHPQVDFNWVKHDEAMPNADLIMLPGSKNIAFDLNWFKLQGWTNDLKHHLRYGGKLIGICGGLQMLGKEIRDPQKIESDHAVISGLGLLDYTTELSSHKQVSNAQGTLTLNGQICQVNGYEIHHGVTQYAKQNAAVNINHRDDGTVSEDNQILTTYLHGLFDHPDALHAILTWAGLNQTDVFDNQTHKTQQLNRLAECVETHLDINAITAIMTKQTSN